MNKCDCNKPKCEPSKCRTDGFVFRKVVIPAQLGDDVTGKDIPENGAMTNSFVTYEANGAQYIYDSFGVYTKFTGGSATVSVISVNGKTGEVVLTTSDLENDSDYVTGTFVTNAISEEATVREGEDERIEGKVDDVADDLEAEATARSDADRQLSLDIGDETTARQGADNDLQSQIDAITASSDVTDIVGTYAELQAYDTSTLGDKDIIKVLQDESQNDETTYYRWSTATQTFTLIGEEGPYYTKSAADTKFQDKLTAGSNITINANNEISATDTTYSDFVGTDGVDAGTAGLVPAPAVGDEDKYLKGDGTWDTVAAGPTVVQTTGTSSTDVMSQVATSQMIYPSGYETSTARIAIGVNASTGGSYSTAIGRFTLAAQDHSIAIGGANNRSNAAVASNTGNIAIGGKAKADVEYYETALGYGAYTAERYSVALGSNSKTSRQYEVSIGSGQAGDAATYKERYLANVKDPILAQDAATKNYTDNLTISYAAINNAGAPTTATEAKYIGQLYYDTTNSDLYYCSAITPQGTDPETYTYTWTAVGGGPTVVQTIGTSTTDVMSQAAASELIYPISQLGNVKKSICIGGATASSANDNIAIGRQASTPSGDENIAIGFHAQVSGFSRNYSTAIGRYSNVATDWGTAIGAGAQVPNQYSASLGDHSRTSRQYEVSIGSGQAGDVSTYKERYLANVKDPSLAQDAATKHYVDTAVASASPTPLTYTQFNTLWSNA